MSETFAILMVLAAVAVLATLILGVFSMVKGGEFNKKYGNRLMRWRVGLQALALVLFAVAMIAHKG